MSVDLNYLSKKDIHITITLFMPKDTRVRLTWCSQAYFWKKQRCIDIHITSTMAKIGICRIGKWKFIADLGGFHNFWSCCV